jgi:hypothetical protein
MNRERRQDIGLKFVYSILTAIIVFLMTTHFNKVSAKADNAEIMGYETKKDVAVLQGGYKEIERRLCSIDIKIDKLLANGK